LEIFLTPKLDGLKPSSSDLLPEGQTSQERLTPDKTKKGFSPDTREQRSWVIG